MTRPNAEKNGLSLSRLIEPEIGQPPFGHIDLAGIRAGRSGSVAGRDAASDLPIEISLAQASLNAGHIAELRGERPIEGSREADIQDLMATLSAFRIRESMREVRKRRIA